MATTVRKISKISGGACYRTLLESFLVLKLLKINFAEKTTLEKVTKIGALFRKKC